MHTAVLFESVNWGGVAVNTIRQTHRVKPIWQFPVLEEKGSVLRAYKGTQQLSQEFPTRLQILALCLSKCQYRDNNGDTETPFNENIIAIT